MQDTEVPSTPEGPDDEPMGADGWLPAGGPFEAHPDTHPDAHDLPADGVRPVSVETEFPGDRIGLYELVRKVGEGGNGTVWHAMRTGWGQPVAIKLLRPGSDEKRVLERFHQERQSLALMDHPGIARVLDAGLTPLGRPYFVMEFVKGQAITDFCDEQELGVEERLELFAQICDAVQHAHHKGIVHRDIKPSNILAYRAPDEGCRVKIIDFGIARTLAGDPSSGAADGAEPLPIGTADYMSPEQIVGGGGDVDTRSDLFSLGVLLHELLVGVVPEHAGTMEQMRDRASSLIRGEELPTVTDRLLQIKAEDPGLAEELALRRGLDTAQLLKRLRGEPEWILRRALQGGREKRYQTALGFATDVRNHLAGRPIVAAPDSTIYDLRKSFRRNPGIFAAVAGLICLLALWGAGSSLGWISERLDIAGGRRAELDGLRREIGDKARELDTMEAAHQGQLHELNTQLGTLTASYAEELKRAAGRQQELDDAQWQLYAASIDRAFRGVVAGDYSTFETELARAKSQLGDGARFETRFLESAGAQSVEELGNLGGRAHAVAWSPDGRLLAACTSGGTIGLWDFGEDNQGRWIWKKRRSIELGSRFGELASLAVSPDGVMVAVGTSNGKILVVDLERGDAVGTPIESGSSRVEALAFMPYGSELVTGGSLGKIRFLGVGAARAGSSAWGLPVRPDIEVGGRIECLAIDRSGRRVTVGDQRGRVCTFSVSDGTPVGPVIQAHDGFVEAIALDHAGGWVLSVGEDGRVCGWDPESGMLKGGQVGFTNRFVQRAIALHPNQSDFTTAGEDRQLRSWTIEAANPADEGGRTLVPWIKPVGDPMSGHKSGVLALAYAPESWPGLLASAGADGKVLLWAKPPISLGGQVFRQEFGPVECIAYDPSSRYIATGGGVGVIQIRHAATGRPYGVPLCGHEGRVWSLAWDGADRIFSVGMDGMLRCWSTVTSNEARPAVRAHDGWATRVALDARRRIVATGGADGEIRLWSADSGSPIGTPLRGHHGRIVGLAFSADGQWIFSACSEGRLFVWSAESAELVSELGPTGMRFEMLAAHPLKPLVIALGCWRDGVPLIQQYDLQLNRVVGTDMVGHTGSVGSIAYSPDGETIASASSDETVRLWNARSGRALFDPLVRMPGWLRCVAFSPDGLQLACGDCAGTVRTWDAVAAADRFDAALDLEAGLRSFRKRYYPEFDSVRGSMRLLADKMAAVRKDPFLRDSSAPYLLIGEYADNLLRSEYRHIGARDFRYVGVGTPGTFDVLGRDLSMPLDEDRAELRRSFLTGIAQELKAGSYEAGASHATLLKGLSALGGSDEEDAETWKLIAEVRLSRGESFDALRALQESLLHAARYRAKVAEAEGAESAAAIRAKAEVDWIVGRIDELVARSAKGAAGR